MVSVVFSTVSSGEANGDGFLLYLLQCSISIPETQNDHSLKTSYVLYAKAIQPVPLSCLLL